MSDPQQPFEERTYQVFNSRRTVGVAAGYGGTTKGIHLSDKCSAMTEKTLAKEIEDTAAVATSRGLLAVREKIEQNAQEAGYGVDPGVYDYLPDVPTQEQHEDFKRANLK
ncbi:hypothetical protein [Mycobacteroides abscessus]